MRALFFGLSFCGEMHVQNRPIISLPVKSPPPWTMHDGSRPPEAIHTEQYVHRPLAVSAYGCAHLVNAFVSSAEPAIGGVLRPEERLKMELLEVRAVLRRLPRDLALCDGGFWLARRLWLAGIEFEERLGEVAFRRGLRFRF